MPASPDFQRKNQEIMSPPPSLLAPVSVDSDQSTTMLNPRGASSVVIAAASATTTSAALKQPLTLIVATTPITNPSNPSKPRLGIGHNGTLPWPRVRSDMGFFARVTTRRPSSASSPGAINAVIMGRKTYDSLPERFRPLPKRLNVIITRDETGEVQRKVTAEWRAARRREMEKMREKEKEKLESSAAATSQSKSVEKDEEADENPEILISNSLESALTTLRQSHSILPSKRIGNIFVIGGSELYSAALRLDPQLLRNDFNLRLLITDVRRSGSDGKDPSNQLDGFECDTFFPLDLIDIENERNWRKADAAEITSWVGEEVSREWKLEGDVAVRMCGYEMID